MTKLETENISYECAKAQETVELTFTAKSTYASGSDVPVRKLILKKECSGRLNCGITPKFSATLWGDTRWEDCAYLNREENENSESPSEEIL